MTDTSSLRPALGISSCLLGEPVRYDGGHKLDTYITEQLAHHFDFVGICPEIAIGLGVPRPPIQLVECRDGIHALGIDDPSMDVTAALRGYGANIIPDLKGMAGYIFKSHSPSCGLAGVRLLNKDGAVELRAQGLFAAEITRLLPELPVIDEQQLADFRQRETFVQCVYTYHMKLYR